MNWSVHPGTKQRGKFNLCPKFVFLSDLADELISELLPWSICRTGEAVKACDHHSLGQVLPLLSPDTNQAKGMNPSTMLTHYSFFLSVSSEQAEAKEIAR